MLTMAEFASRRTTLMQQIGPTSIVILNAASILARNHYHEFPFRQDSNFYYLTGFDEPDATLVLMPKHQGGEFILFNRPRDHEQEIWNGYRAGQDGAQQLFGANQAFRYDELEKYLPELLEGKEKIYCALGACRQFDKILIRAANTIHAKIRSGIQAPFAFNDIRPLLHEMRIKKSPTEIALMRKAAEITADGHNRAMRFCQPDINEFQLEAELSHEFQRQGARYHAYTPIVGSGKNSCILHYIRNDQPIKTGDLVLIDAGAEYQYYAADVTRTFPANGHFSAEQRAIYEIVLTAQLAGIEAIRPGTAWNHIEDQITQIITQGLVDVGLLTGNVADLIEQKAYAPFYMHKSGHWLGLDTHDAGQYKIHNRWRSLESNMVRTVEPGIYISADIPGISTRWHNIGIRIEDDVLVTEHGSEVFSHSAPKQIDEIEALMST